MRPIRILVLAAALGPAAIASQLDLEVRSAGSSSIVVGPGDSVSWQVVGELSDANNLGLALFLCDVHFDGGDLAPASVPTAPPMNAFAPPLGMSNPAGFGGTLSDGDLIQAGGAMNTIKNTFAAQPIGPVLTGVAAAGAPQVLMSGTLTAPIDPGTYALSLDHVLANVIRPGENGTPFWRVEPAGIGSVTDLVIEVQALSANVPTVSIAAFGSQVLSLDAGQVNAGRAYFLLGTFTGPLPGFNLAGGLHVPLNVDLYFQLTVSFPNTWLANSFGTLDGLGKATATFTALPGTPAAAAGLVLHHAFVLLPQKDFASNAVSLTLQP